MRFSNLATSEREHRRAERSGKHHRGTRLAEQRPRGVERLVRVRRRLRVVGIRARPARRKIRPIRLPHHISARGGKARGGRTPMGRVASVNLHESELQRHLLPIGSQNGVLQFAGTARTRNQLRRRARRAKGDARLQRACLAESCAGTGVPRLGCVTGHPYYRAP